MENRIDKLVISPVGKTLKNHPIITDIKNNVADKKIVVVSDIQESRELRELGIEVIPLRLLKEEKIFVSSILQDKNKLSRLLICYKKILENYHQNYEIREKTLHIISMICLKSSVSENNTPLDALKKLNNYQKSGNIDGLKSVLSKITDKENNNDFSKLIKYIIEKMDSLCI